MTLKTKLPREALLVFRETGLRALWLAYPLVFVPSPSPDRSDFMLAPVFLWPLQITGDGLPEATIEIRRDLAAGLPRFNRVAWQWIRNHLDLDLPEPTNGDIQGLDSLEELNRVLSLCCRFDTSSSFQIHGAISGVPEKAALEKVREPQLFNAGLLGLIVWENMELLADLDRIGESEEWGDGLGDFLGPPRERTRAAVTIPSESDRYLVTDCDESQELAVWRSRTGQGLVVHGPPGTGKSQVIVNIVSDALAHGESVLVVCQKKAALDVVSSRLKAAGLGSHFLQVDDAESDRRRIIEHLRTSRIAPNPIAARERESLSAEITELEDGFRQYSAALFSVLAERGISYRTMLARLAAIRRLEATTNPIDGLASVFAASSAIQLDQAAKFLQEIEPWHWEAGLPSNPWRYALAEVRADEYELRGILQGVARFRATSLELDSTAAEKHPKLSRAPLVGDLDAIATSTTVLTRVALERFKLTPASEIVEIDAASYSTAAQFSQSLLKYRTSVLRWIRPEYFRSQKWLRNFFSSRPWLLRSTGPSLLAHIERRAVTAKAGLSTVEALRQWLLPAYLQELEHAARTAVLLGPEAAALEEGAPRLPSLLRFRAAVSGSGSAVQSIVHTLTSAATIPRSWATVLRLSCLLEWAATAEQATPILRSLTPEVYKARQSRLAQAHERKRALEASAIANRTAQKAHLVDSQWMRSLVFRGPRSRRAREVFDEGLGKGLLASCPCWLMNPGTVSQVLPLRQDMFDIVIFDEASQCPPEYAVPALFRGRRVVVAGDRKQLPPTMFFKSTFDFDDEEEPVADDPTSHETEVATGAEDLLSIAEARLSGSHLNVHYRSLHPALISFSNAAFYSNSLQTPPLPRVPEASNGGVGVYLEAVNGIYLRDRTNPSEAERLVQFLASLWSSTVSPPSIGVVTFNQAQKDAIEDRIDTLRATDLSFAAAYGRESTRQEHGQDLGFFVRSLEAVQGDERDVVLFSTTYGRREDGSFSRAFLGPINQSGGERRLNVAITRAKKWVRIFTSLPIGQISEALHPGSVLQGQGIGRGMLQLYLEYARLLTAGELEGAQAVLARALEIGGRTYGNPDGPGAEDSEFEIEVAEAIESRLGFAVRRQVHAGAFRIDLGICHPRDRHAYVLGIECDGRAYHSAPSVRAYDIWRQRLLEERGWSIHRVWSTEWWRDSDRELQQIAARVAALGGA